MEPYIARQIGKSTGMKDHNTTQDYDTFNIKNNHLNNHIEAIKVWQENDPDDNKSMEEEASMEENYITISNLNTIQDVNMAQLIINTETVNRPSFQKKTHPYSS